MKSPGPSAPSSADGAGQGGADDETFDDWSVEPERDGATCDRLDETFDNFVQAHLTCSRDEECDVIGDCSPNADFRAVRRDAAAEAYRLMQARCGGASDGPVFRPLCAAGRCSLEERTDTCCGCPADLDAGL